MWIQARRHQDTLELIEGLALQVYDMIPSTSSLSADVLQQQLNDVLNSKQMHVLVQELTGLPVSLRPNARITPLVALALVLKLAPHVTKNVS
jgi:hypothetical protein